MTAYEMRISDWSSDVCSSDLVRNARRDQAFVEVTARRDAKPAIVQPGTAAALGPIAFVGDGLIDERRRHLAPAAAGLGLLHRDRDREMRDRVEEVRGAVERVDDETRLARIALDLARLFHLEAPARARVGQLVIERALGRLVGLRHEIGRALLRKDWKSTRRNSIH